MSLAEVSERLQETRATLNMPVDEESARFVHAGKLIQPRLEEIVEKARDEGVATRFIVQQLLETTTENAARIAGNA